MLPWEYLAAAVTDTGLPRQVGSVSARLVVVGDGQQAVGVAQGAAPHLSSLQLQMVGVNVADACPALAAVAPTVQQVLEVEIAAGEQVGGRGVEGGGELQDGGLGVLNAGNRGSETEKVFLDKI